MRLLLVALVWVALVIAQQEPLFASPPLVNPYKLTRTTYTDVDRDARNRPVVLVQATAGSNDRWEPVQSGTLLVSTMDGSLHGIDVATGAHLWAFRKRVAQPRNQPTGFDVNFEGPNTDDSEGS